MSRAAMSIDLAAAPRVEGRTRPPAIPVERRERVLDAATALFHQRGYRAVSVEEIADASQTAIATVYQVVPSKAHLLGAILARGSEGAIYVTRHRLAFAPEAETPLETFVNTYAELACGAHSRILKLLTADAVYLDEEAAEFMRRSQREYVEDWVRALLEQRPELSLTQGRAIVPRRPASSTTRSRSEAYKGRRICKANSARSPRRSCRRSWA
jgi:AcrR family transcriptional regulator